MAGLSSRVNAKVVARLVSFSSLGEVEVFGSGIFSGSSIINVEVQ